MNPFWQISTGDLFEWLRPASYALAVLVSACVLYDTLRRNLKIYAVVLWTLATFFLPLVALPLYLLALLVRRMRAPSSAPPCEAVPAQPSSHPTPTARRAHRIILPVVYAAAALALGGVVFQRDRQSADAHLERAANARLRNRHARAVEEYRAALRLGDDPHTRKLLALALSEAGRHAEALEEFRAALRAGEPDDKLPYYIARTLDALKRTDEARAEYQKFLDGNLCTQTPPDPLCQKAQARLNRTNM